MKKIIFFALILSLTTLSACYWDNEEALYGNLPAEVCDTTNVTYSLKVKPILEQHCTVCHAKAVSASVGGSVILDNPLDVKKMSSKMLSSIKHESSNPMPKGAAKMEDCHIQQIEQWIKRGAKND